MAGPGRIPKPAHKKQRARKKPVAAVLRADPAKPPKLPTRKPAWTAGTKRWWAAVWASPMASNFLDADVPALLRIAELVERLARLDPEETSLAVKLASEIRLQEGRFGLTPADRARLHWAVGPTPEQPSKPKRTRPKRDPRDLLREAIEKENNEQ